MSSVSPTDTTPPLSSSRGLLRGTSIVAGLTMISRVLGFVRDLLLARLFGTSAVADAFFVAFRIPNLLRSFVAEGALTSAFVPVFSSELRRSTEAARRTVHAVTTLLLLTTVSLSVLGIIFAPQVVDVFAPGFRATSEKAQLCVDLLRIMLPYIVFVSMVAMINGALNTVKIFGIAAFAQVVMNVILIVGALVAGLFEERTAAVALSVSVIIGGVAQVIAQIPALRRSGFSLGLTLRPFTGATREVLRLMAPAVVGATVYQLSIFLNTVFASLLVTGSVSWLFYADRVTQLPLGVFSIALASVLLPTLARAHAEDDRQAFGDSFTDSLRFTSFCILPLAAAIFLFAEPIIRLAFQRGAFDLRATMQTAAAVQALAIGIWAVSCHSLISRALIAQKDTRTPTVIGVCTLLSTAVLSVFLMGAPSHSATSSIATLIVAVQRWMESVWGELPQFGHVGLALASSSSAFLGALLLGVMLHRRSPGLPWQRFFAASAKGLVASAGSGWLSTIIASQIDHELLSTAVGLSAMAIIYLVLCVILRMREAEETLALVARYIQRRRTH